MDVRALVGLNLRRLRVEVRLTQEALALLVGFEPSYVGRIERGTENVTVTTLEKLAKPLGIHVSAFFDLSAANAPKPSVLAPGRKPKAVRPPQP